MLGHIAGCPMIALDVPCHLFLRAKHGCPVGSQLVW